MNDLRARGTDVDEVRLDDGTGAGEVPGWVLDRSIGGLGLLVDAPVAVGAVLKLLPRTAPEGALWVVATVRSCKRNGTQYEIGCQFHRTPSWDVMLQFG